MAVPQFPVTFAIALRNRLVPESELNALLDSLIADAELRIPLSGAICFFDDQGNSACIEDSLEYLFFHLTGKGWQELNAGGKLHLAHWEYEGNFTLLIQEGFFSIQDNYQNSSLVFDATPTMEGLLDCAGRYLTFLKVIQTAHAGVATEIRLLEDALRQNAG